MSQYAINDTSLSAIGDAIRQKKGEDPNLYWEYELDLETVEIYTSATNKTYYIVPIAHPESVNKFTLIINPTEGSSHTLTVWGKKQSDETLYLIKNITFYSNNINYYDFTYNYNSEFLNGNYFYKDYLYISTPATSTNADFLGFTTDLVEGPNPDTHYLPSEMGDEILNLDVVPSEGFNITGNCGYMFSYDGWNWYINHFGNKIITNNITNANNMFNYNPRSTIPFEINLRNVSNEVINCQSLFDGCNYLSTVPYITGRPGNIANLFTGCNRLTTIPNDWADKINWTGIQNVSSIQCQSIFSNCFSLRYIPQNLIDNLYTNPTSQTYFYFPYYNTFTYCRILEEVNNMPVIPYCTGSTAQTPITSNLFTNCLQYNNRLAHFTFAMDNNTPIVVKWKSQTIDFSTKTGYANGTNDIIVYSSVHGITATTRITDATSYELLKDDPDSWTTDKNYSRYNHDSAVETINSLPDASAYLATAGGTNTIKFEGASGALTDGGAINTLTAEEIAVATAKGWTVSLV